MAQDEIEIILERGQRLSCSLLWRLQRAFYEGRGAEAWSRGTVPSYITSNAVIGRAHARIVGAFLREWQARVPGGLDRRQPVYIVELGAGSGRFGYHFLHAFLAAHARSVLAEAPVTYVMTDLSRRALDTLRAHPWLAPLVERGVLDFAHFDAVAPDALTLLRSGAVLASGTLANPLFVLGNYFFDSIPQDCFIVEGGRLYEGLPILSMRQPDVGLSARKIDVDAANPDPALLDQLTVAYERRRVERASGYYGDPDLDALLGAYESGLPDTTITLPTAALRCLRYLRTLSDDRLLMVAADKGYCRQGDLAGRAAPSLNKHGSFSLMVNFHAIGAYVAGQGGAVWHPSYRPAHLATVAYLLAPGASDFTETAQAYDEAVEQGSPDDFFVVKRAIEPHYESMGMDELLAYLRLAGWDSGVFLGIFPALLDRLGAASEPQQEEMRRAIARVWELYLPIGEEQDLAFALGLLLYNMRRYQEALRYFEQSLRLHGPDPSTLFNAGLCHYYLRQPREALTYIDETLRREPSFEGAEAIRARIREQLSR